ncbi:MAG TPA: hypothetical protein VF170_18895 [Planctomycetaceae bacterium]
MTYSFRLRIGGVPYERFEPFADALFSPDVDCTASYRAGAAGVHFTWEADSLREAVRLAVAHVHRADPAARVLAIEADEGHSLDEAFAA